MWPVSGWVTNRLLMTYKIGEEGRCRIDRARENALQAVYRDRPNLLEINEFLVNSTGFQGWLHAQPCREY